MQAESAKNCIFHGNCEMQSLHGGAVAPARFDKEKTWVKLSPSAEVIAASTAVARGNRPPGFARTQDGAHGAGNRSQGPLPRPSPTANLAGSNGRDDLSGVRFADFMVSPTATSCTRRETGSRGTSPHETMNCPNCQTPTEDGLIHRVLWFKKPIDGIVRRMEPTAP